MTDATREVTARKITSLESIMIPVLSTDKAVLVPVLYYSRLVEICREVGGFLHLFICSYKYLS